MKYIPQLAIIFGFTLLGEALQLVGAVSSLSLVSAGLLTAVILPFLFPYI